MIFLFSFMLYIFYIVILDIAGTVAAADLGAVLEEALVAHLHEDRGFVEAAQTGGAAADHRGGELGEGDGEVVVEAAGVGDVYVDAFLEDQGRALSVAGRVAKMDQSTGVEKVLGTVVDGDVEELLHFGLEHILMPWNGREGRVRLEEVGRKGNDVIP